MQLHGEYTHRLDAQGRVAVPARYRDAFRGGIFLTRGFDPCVWAFTPAEWEAYSAKYAATSPNARMNRLLRRRVFGSTFELELDRQGRVVVPAPLRAHGALADELVIVGAGTYLELWDRGRWDAQVAELDALDLDLPEGEA